MLQGGYTDCLDKGMNPTDPQNPPDALPGVFSPITSIAFPLIDRNRVAGHETGWDMLEAADHGIEGVVRWFRSPIAGTARGAQVNHVTFCIPHDENLNPALVEAARRAT